MIKRAVFIILCLSTIAAFPGMGGVRNNLSKSAEEPPACADSSCTGFDVCQNFEGTANDGYDNSESWTEQNTTVDPDYATSAMRGSQMLHVQYTTGAALAYITFTARGEVYGFVRFKTADATPASSKIIVSLSDGSTNPFALWLTSAGKLSVDNGNQWNGATTGGLSDNTEYHIWFYYKKETVAGNDGISWVSFADSSTFSPTLSGDNYTEVTNGDADLDVSHLFLREPNGEAVYFDPVLLRSTSIGTVCN
jgi:hypothetical protein